MKIQIANKLLALLSLTFVVSLTGCDRLPEHLTQQVEKMPEKISAQKAFTQKSQKEFEGFKSDPEWQFFKPYLEKEQWSDSYKQATDATIKGEQVYAQKIKPVVKLNESKDTQKLNHLISEFNDHLNDSKKAAQTPKLRKAFLIKAKNESQKIYKKAQSDIVDINARIKGMYDYAQKASQSYPKKAKDITLKLQFMKQFEKTSKTTMEVLTQEYNKRESRQTDYAMFADSAQKITDLVKKVKAVEHKLTKKLHELFESYTKILTDQRIEYFVVIGRATWCEGEYCNDGSTMNYPPVKVDDVVYEYLGSLETLVASYKNTYFSGEKFTLKIAQKYWDALRLSPKHQWPHGDDYGEYWVEKAYAKPFHKYTEINNGEQKESKWLPVSEDFYWKHQEDLGLTIISKPYGVYKEETLNQSAPVGMSMIAQPTMNGTQATGSNEYGEWRQNNGHSFWHYYGQYALMKSLLGNNRGYSYDEWNGYNSRNKRQNYYGSNHEYGTYGSRTYQNNRYSRSDFAKRNASQVSQIRSNPNVSRSNTRSKPSVRNAGSTSRNRGPSGGGK